MAKTLTTTGIRKIGERFSESIDHAAYTLNGQPKTVEIFRKTTTDTTVDIYVYFDDTVVGEVGAVELVDKDGDTVATSDWSFAKSASKGLYVAFKYNIIEKEMEVSIADGPV